MRQIKFRAWFNGRYFYSDDVTFCFRSGRIYFFDSYGDRYDVDPDNLEQFIATDKDGYDVYEGDTLKFLFYIDRDGNTKPYKREVSRYAEFNHILDIQIGFAIKVGGHSCSNID